ncbi:MAG: PadR family transcriptional regulator [Myxococcota bacterium]|nr:PadR family transcriptional regulator [Myxococcota bacterium]
MPLKHTLLGFLQKQPMHGYNLRRQAREYAWIYPMANASIYPALHSLEKDGFISHESEIHNGRARKVYQITEAGRQELLNWLGEQESTKRSHRDQALLKIAMQNDETIGGARRWIQDALRQLDVELQEIRKGGIHNGMPSDYSDLALTYGTELIMLRKRFLEKVLETSGASQRNAASVGLSRVRNSESLTA